MIVIIQTILFLIPINPLILAVPRPPRRCSLNGDCENPDACILTLCLNPCLTDNPCDQTAICRQTHRSIRCILDWPSFTISFFLFICFLCYGFYIRLIRYLITSKKNGKYSLNLMPCSGQITWLCLWPFLISIKYIYCVQTVQSYSILLLPGGNPGGPIPPVLQGTKYVLTPWFLD